MTVLILDSPKPAIRGQLKRWFVELRPNIFVSSINEMVLGNVLEFLGGYGKLDGMVVCKAHNSQGYIIRALGASCNRYKGFEMGDLSLVINNLETVSAESVPF